MAANPKGRVTTNDLSSALETLSFDAAKETELCTTTPPGEAGGALPFVPVPDEGWAKDEWKETLRVLHRGSPLHVKMQAMHRDDAKSRQLTKGGRRRTESWLYVMVSPTRPGCKIGKADDAESRRMQLHAGTPDIWVASIYHCLDAFHAETLAHHMGRTVEGSRLFAGEDEWFHLTQYEASVLIQTAIWVIEDALSSRICRTTSTADKSA
jgi:hypothetical protein